MTDIRALEKEREQIFINLYRGKVPTRVPVSNPMALEACLEYAGANPVEVLWDVSKTEAVFDQVNTDFYSDTSVGGTRRYPSFYQVLGARSFVMSSTGAMQHPNVHGMEAAEYDDFIDNPYDTIMEKILPRLYTELATDAATRAAVLAKAMNIRSSEFAVLGRIGVKMREKYGFAAIPGNATTAPFDFIADFFRSFTGICSDIRRYPEKVIAACEAMTPITIKKGRIPFPSKIGVTGIPLHMAPFMRTKDFEKFYWPSLKKVVETFHAMGINASLFVEHDFMRFLDYLSELPENTILRFEYGDPKIVKEKLGSKQIISGFYPVMLLHTGTKQQCLDKAKELMDILAPGGRFWFNTDKGPMDMHGNIAENLRAVLEFVYDYGKYEHPDEPYNLAHEPQPQADKVINEINANLNSKYYYTWQDYQTRYPELAQRTEQIIARQLQKNEDAFFDFIINLCS
ncbi:MAG TPA: uroporphyrinogen decarboxylase family protein [Oscillospiraceae bacterium]|nr:uroporphyrinogen decarboxylase family protein [Oscillospiraceae bacterium]